MFTIDQIQEAHRKVKSGADFPAYISEIKSLGVKAYETHSQDGHSVYYNDHNESVSSPAKYADTEIVNECNPNKFREYLQIHQQGKTDFLTFCQHCAETGIRYWLVDLNKMTCVYFANENTLVFEEEINL